MKIAVLAFSALPNSVGGAQIFTFNFIQELLKRNHTVHFYLPRKCVNDLKKAFPNRSSALKIIPLSIFENGLSRYVPVVLYAIILLRQMLHHYDVWQVIGAYPAGFITKWLKHRVPVILRSYGSDIQKDQELKYGLRLDPLFDRRITRAVRDMSSLVALTSTVRDCYLEIGAQQDRIVEISNAIDFSRFQGRVDPEAIRSGLGIGKGRTFILSTGRYHVKKGYEYIPAAAKMLADMGFDIQWLVVGNGVQALRELVEEHKVSNRVILKDGIGVRMEAGQDEMGTVPSKPLIDLYRSADIYAMPSLLETFGMVLIEAMASGLPVVTTDAPGCRDVVTHGVNGLQARAADSGSLADAIGKVLRDPALRSALIANGLETARKHDWEYVVAKYEDLYAEMVRG